MTDANPLAWVLASLKTHPEPVSIPDVSELTPVELAAIRSRLQTFSQVANELRKLVDVEMAKGLVGSVMRYGDTIYRPTGGRGDNYVKDETAWWEVVVKGLKVSPRPVELLAALVSSDVKVTGIPMLAAALGEDADKLRAAHIANKETDAPLEAKPLFKAPQFLQKLEEGEIRAVHKGKLLNDRSTDVRSDST